MKKLVAIFLVLAAMMGAMASAEGMGVTVIGGMEMESVSLDDMKLNAACEIPGYGIVTATSFATIDYLNHYREGSSSVNNFGCFSSGHEADYAVLKMDILNTQTTPANFLANCEVKVVYDDSFEFGGWSYQFNHDNQTNNWNSDTPTANINFVILKSDNFVIKPMYMGHYVFGCTLPNAVINSKAPLKMIITIDGNEITYNIRK